MSKIWVKTGTTLLGKHKKKKVWSNRIAPGVVYMPSAGPFAGLPQDQPVTNYSSFLINGNLIATGDDQSEGAPLNYNKLTIAGGSVSAYAPDGGQPIDFAIPTGIFLRVNELAVTAAGGTMGYVGGAGTDGISTCFSSGGSGGCGASGGGGGSSLNFATCPCTPTCCPIYLPGGMGGSGNNGASGNEAFCGGPGPGGQGNAQDLIYDFGLGGDGGGSFGGPKVNGAGGGGSGGDVNIMPGPCTNPAGGGGGGGGGLLCVVGNLLSGTPVHISCQGGSGGFGSGIGSYNGGDGGPGVIWLAFKRKTATNIIVSNYGTLKLFKINSDNTLTAKNVTDVW